jgi:hypothetical protein
MSAARAALFDEIEPLYRAVVLTEELDANRHVRPSRRDHQLKGLLKEYFTPC